MRERNAPDTRATHHFMATTGILRRNGQIGFALSCGRAGRRSEIMTNSSRNVKLGAALAGIMAAAALAGCASQASTPPPAPPPAEQSMQQTAPPPPPPQDQGSMTNTNTNMSNGAGSGGATSGGAGSGGPSGP
jgi:hypothetical protein